MVKKIRNWLSMGAFYLLTLVSTASAAIEDEKVMPYDPGYRAVEPGPITGVGTGPLKLENPLGKESIIDVINSVLNYLIYISVPILAFMILWGGFQILTARDDPEKVKNGRKTIQWASVGFAVILISKGVALILLKILKG